MGKSQKQKGRNQEYVLRDCLRRHGWTAERVYASGAIAGLPGDVKGTHPEHGEKLFEMKARKASFQSLYDLYSEWRRTKQDDLLALAIPEGSKLCISMSDSPDAIFDNPDYYEPATKDHPLYKRFSRTFSKLSNLQKLLGKADILCVKDDRKPILFIRYR